MNRYLRFTPEAVAKTYATGGAHRYFPLDGNNGFRPLIQVPTASIRHPGQNVPWLKFREVYTVAGDWSDRHYWENTDALLWLNRVGGTGTTPWTTDQRDGDGASATIDYDYSYFDGTLKPVRYAGLKIGQTWQLDCKNDPANPWLSFRYSLLGSTALPDPITGGSPPTIPAPDCEDDYPNEPLSFWQMVFTYAGGAMEFFDSISIKGQNVVTTHFDSKRYTNRIHHHGRTVTFSARLRLDVATDPRAVYEAQTAIGDCKLTFTRPGGTPDVVEIDFRAKSRADSVDEEHVIDADGYTTVSATAHLDCDAGDDFGITFIPD